MELETEAGSPVIRIIGQLWQREDILSLQETIIALQESGVARIVLDLERLTFINSIGLGALVRFFAHLSRSGSELILFRPAENVLETMLISDFPRFIRIVQTPQELDGLPHTATHRDGPTPPESVAPADAPPSAPPPRP